MAKKKAEATCFEPGQIVRLKKPVLLWGNAWLGIEYNPPKVLFDVGSLARVLSASDDHNRYKVDLGDFVITLPVVNLEAVI
ncbi:MAG: hypothetical protein BroJett038_12460 [Chloroflexota bacterium]|nr:MAG: hypothetical protein BroJett038_12460 [Chloroflexota bacterium]